MPVTTRSQTRSKALAWTSFPAEIRLIILATIANQKHPGWASPASVCREWQHVLEKANFHKIKLRVPCLDEFEHIAAPQKRELIRHICLNVELPRYTSTCCSKRRSPSARISSIVSDGIWKLFSILSTWGPANNLALEINVYSPSDCEHWFKNIYLSSDDVEHHEDAMPNAWRTGSQYHDPQHGWMHGQQIKGPPRTALLQLFRPIRRQLRRCISPLELGLLLSSFDRLKHISYEPWAPYEVANKEFHLIGLYFAMRNNLPDTLDKLIVFEDSYKFYDSFPKRLAHIHWFNLLDSSQGLGAVFASKSLILQHLSISFMINAEELFRHCQSTWSWLHLQSLALTSQLLQDDWEKRKQIEALLCRARVIVQNMPKLHTFVLWNGGKAHACAFIYRTDRDSASITWRGTWHLVLSPRVVKLWQLAALKLPRSEFSELQVKHEYIQADIKSHGDAIYHLELPCQVIDPASLWQIRREGYSLAQ
ncbi:uncharacterized protein F4812DRAFT_470273 [Daldinia caldariorum]|uniref:uncharacterized protein n=1 Tax=Daldinia caldariorum TaxID=326644 RepID=UPI0020072E04|nr:uncharacterized protein F4812DRAFT_470273 [Daldinia caldariorum]KAI1469211.1 hypothetical protein F4812DRAFT_470273 [Daldinia caldariorum]